MRFGIPVRRRMGTTTFPFTVGRLVFTSLPGLGSPGDKMDASFARAVFIARDRLDHSLLYKPVASSHSD